MIFGLNNASSAAQILFCSYFLNWAKLLHSSVTPHGKRSTRSWDFAAKRRTQAWGGVAGGKILV